jgi:phage-related tail protein
MTLDYTYLMQLPTRELIERARMCTGLTTSAAQTMRALADTLEDMQGIFNLYEKTRDALTAAEARNQDLENEVRELMRRLDRSFV